MKSVTFGGHCGAEYKRDCKGKYNYLFVVQFSAENFKIDDLEITSDIF